MPSVSSSPTLQICRTCGGGAPIDVHFCPQCTKILALGRHGDYFAFLGVPRKLNLDPHELGLYSQVADSLDLDPPTPDLVVYLQAPAPVLMRRVAMRGIAYEQLIDQEYLERLGEAYARFFYDFEEAPLLIVNAASIDPINRESDYQELLQAIVRVKRGRHFFNPAGSSFG